MRFQFSSLIVLVLMASQGSPALAQDPDEPTYMVTIEYLATYFDERELLMYHPARMTITPLRANAQPPWKGDLQSVSIEGLREPDSRVEAHAREAGFPRIVSGPIPLDRAVQIYAPSPRNLKSFYFQGDYELVIRDINTRHHNPTTHRDEGAVWTERAQLRGSIVRVRL